MRFSDTPLTASRFALIGLALLVPVLVWDFTGLDLPLARWFGTAQGFPLEHNWWLEKVLHTRARRASWVVEALLVLTALWPWGPFKAVPRADRIGLAVSAFTGVLAVQLMKRASDTSCPWDLAEFGGTAQYVSHWLWGVVDGGGGHCFPAGHASSAFCFLAGWFWLRPSAPRLARAWLVLWLVLGLAFGLVQMLRGAHYFSHVLWAGWVCWVAGGLFWLACEWRRGRRRLA